MKTNMKKNSKQPNKANAKLKGELQQIKQEEKKTRDKVKKTNKRLNQLQSRTTFLSKYGSTLGTVDRTTARDVNCLLHSLFDVRHGVERTTAQGYVETATCVVTFTKRITIAAGKWWTALYSPSAQPVGATGGTPDLATGSFCWFIDSTGANNYQSPFSTTDAPTITNVSNPFYNASYMNTPGTSFRCIGASIVLTPIVAPINQAGSGLMWYDPEFYAGLPSTTTQRFTIQETSINTLHIKARFNGTEKRIGQPPPNDDEFDLQSALSNRDTTSAMGMGIFNPDSTSISYQIEITQGYEYEPTTSIRNIVSVGTPSMSDLVWPHLSLFVMANWDRFVLSSWDRYLSDISQISRLSMTEGPPNKNMYEYKNGKAVGKVPSGYENYPLGKY